MERLSNIMRTTQQRSRPAAEQRLAQRQSAQGQRPFSSVRRALPEQNGRLGIPNRPPELYAGHPAQHTPEVQEEDWEEPVSAPSRPVTRPAYHSPRVGRPGSRYSEHPPQGDYYEDEENLAGAPAQSSQDWSDDTAAMRYGDWENAPGYQYTSEYPEESNYLPPTPRVREPRASAQELSPVAQRLMQQHGKGSPLVTRELHRVTPENIRPLSTREGRLPVPTTHAQSVAIPQSQLPPQRTTQPLKVQQMARLQAEMHQRSLRPTRPKLPEPLSENGADYTITLNAPVSLCPVCKGAGFLRSNVPFGHPQFGKAVACQCKEQERKRKRRQQLQEISNLGAFASKRFESFNPRMPGLQEAFQVSIEFAKAPCGWLLLVGPNGCGKTHLAAAIANQCLESGAVVLFATVPDLLDHLRAAFAPDSNEIYDQLFARMREAEVLVLDDLGTQQSSPWANEKLFQLLNYRYNSGFPTVITANPRGLQTTDERLRSRLSDIGLVTTLNLDRARDYRPNNPHRD